MIFGSSRAGDYLLAYTGVGVMYLIQWIILFFVYAFFSVLIAEVLGLPPEAVFWGVPVIFILVVVVIFLRAIFVSFKGEKPNTSKVHVTDWRQRNRAKLQEQIDVVESIFEKVKDSSLDITSELLRAFKLKEYHHGFNEAENIYLWLILGGEISDADVIPDIESSISEYFSEDLASSYKQKRDFVINKIRNRGRQTISIKRLLDEMVKTMDSAKPDFPTNLSLVNVAAIPPGSFLENGIPREYNLEKMLFTSRFTIQQLLQASKLFREHMEEERFNRFLSATLDRYRSKSFKKISKVLSKERITASDVKNVVSWATAFCYSESDDDLRYASSVVNNVKDKARQQKQTKAMLSALQLAEEFLRLPKGPGEALAEERVQILANQVQSLINRMNDQPQMVDASFVNECLSIASNYMQLSLAEMEEAHIGSLVEALRFARINISDAKYDDIQIASKSEELSSLLKELIDMAHKAGGSR